MRGEHLLPEHAARGRPGRAARRLPAGPAPREGLPRHQGGLPPGADRPRVHRAVGVLQFARRRAPRGRAAAPGRRRGHARRRGPRRHRADRRLHLPAAAHLLPRRALPSVQRGRRGHRRGERHRCGRPQTPRGRPPGRRHGVRGRHGLRRQQRRRGQARLQRARPLRPAGRDPGRPAPWRPQGNRRRLCGGARHGHRPGRPGGGRRAARRVRPGGRRRRGAVVREEPDRASGRRGGRRRHGPCRARRPPRGDPAHRGLRPPQSGDRRGAVPGAGDRRALAR